MSARKNQITTYPPFPLLEKVKKEANERGISTSQVVAQIIRKHYRGEVTK